MTIPMTERATQLEEAINDLSHLEGLARQHGNGLRAWVLQLAVELYEAELARLAQFDPATPS
jgi:hypothetical protein